MIRGSQQIILFAPRKGRRGTSAWAVPFANAREDLLPDVYSPGNICVSLCSPDVGNASLASICSMIRTAMQEFPILPVVDVSANVVRDCSAAAAESKAVERDQRIYTHVLVSSELIKHLIATSAMAHDMDTTRILLIGSQPRNHVRGLAWTANVWGLLSDGSEPRLESLHASLT
jgi:hypothetical protein